MRHTIVRDGVVAGVLGATAVAVWFLGLDTLRGHPFATPAALGRGLVGILGPHGSEGNGPSRASGTAAESRSADSRVALPGTSRT